MNIIVALIGLGIPIILLALLITSLLDNQFAYMCTKHLKFRRPYQYIALYLILLSILILSISLPFQWKTTKPNTQLAEQNIVSVSKTLTTQNCITVQTENGDIIINISESNIPITLIADAIQHPEQYKIVYYTNRIGFIVTNSPVIKKRYEVTT